MHIQKFAFDKYKIAAPTATKLKEHYDSVKQKRDGVPYHEWLQEDRKSNPEPYAMWNNECVKSGQSNASDFMKKVMNPNDSDHESALNTYVTKFNSDRNNAEAYFTDRARKLMDAKKLEIKNTAYESKLTKDFTPVTAEDGAFLNKLKNLLKSKADAYGYDGDEDLIKAFVADHPFSSQFRNAIESNPNSIFYKQPNLLAAWRNP